ncbi:MAG: EamA family transporter [Candidatus Hermodarchaeota archaeon]
MQNKYILYIISASILWSLIPVLVIGLFDEISILTIIFLRFFVSGVFFLGISIYFVFKNNRNANAEMKISLKLFFKFSLQKNDKFFGVRKIFYYLSLGFFGIILTIIGYFLALKTTTIAFAMIGYQLSIIFIAFYEHGVKSERLDFFKLLYLLILIFSIGIIIFVELQISNPQKNNITFWGFFYILLFTICATFFQIGMTKDSYTNKEIKLINSNRNYKIAHLNFRIAMTFLLGVGFLFPFILIFHLIPFKGDLTYEIDQFYIDLTNIFQIMFRWEILFLIIFSTIIPYLLIFIAEVNWSPYELTYGQWGSILAVIEPIGGLLFGILLVRGQDFPLEYLTIILFLLMLSILFRYAHETKNKVNAFVLINHEFGIMKNTPMNLIRFEGVHSVNSLIGAHDLLLNVKTNSIKDLYYLIDTQIRNLEGIKKVKILFIKKINKITVT